MNNYIQEVNENLVGQDVMFFLPKDNRKYFGTCINVKDEETFVIRRVDGVIFLVNMHFIRCNNGKYDSVNNE